MRGDRRCTAATCRGRRKSAAVSESSGVRSVRCQFPNTAWIKARRTLFLTTNVALNKPKEAVEAAKTILANDPKDFTAQYYIMYFTQSLYGAKQSPEILDQGEKAASGILAAIGTPPPNVKDEDWAKLRPDVELMAHVNLGFIAMQRKKWDGAEAEFLKTLQMRPNNGQVDFWLGYVMGYQKRIPAAVFYFARAGTFEGPGAADPAVRKQALDFAAKQYKSYHGSNEGFNEVVLAQAKNNAILPPDFKIKSAKEIADEQAAAQAEKDKQNPELALWKQLKGTLTSADGASYFSSSMKDALIPTLKGKVVSIQPPIKPRGWNHRGCNAEIRNAASGQSGARHGIVLRGYSGTLYGCAVHGGFQRRQGQAARLDREKCANWPGSSQNAYKQEISDGLYLEWSDVERKRRFWEAGSVVSTI